MQSEKQSIRPSGLPLLPSPNLATGPSGRTVAPQIYIVLAFRRHRVIFGAIGWPRGTCTRLARLVFARPTFRCDCDERSRSLLAIAAAARGFAGRLAALPPHYSGRTPSMKLRVGLIGLGPHWENRYRPALRALSDRFEVKAVYDQVSHRAQQAAREFDAKNVEGVRALCQRHDVDAVLILAKQWLGTLSILAACDAGKAVYCAAHLDLELSEALHIRDRVKQAGIAFMAELPRRHAPATIRLKELMATRLGKPNLVFAHLRNPAEKKVAASKTVWHPPAVQTSIADLVEQVDWCRYVVGEEPTSVLGLVHRHVSDASLEDYQMMSLDFSPSGQPGFGAVAQISSGRYVLPEWEEAVTFRPPAGLQVSCEKGIAFIDLPAKLIYFDQAGRHQESLDGERPLGELLLLRFYRNVTSLVLPSSSMDDTCRALEIVLQARTSHADGHRISVTASPEQNGKPKTIEAVEPEARLE